MVLEIQNSVYTWSSCENEIKKIKNPLLLSKMILSLKEHILKIRPEDFRHSANDLSNFRDKRLVKR